MFIFIILWSFVSLFDYFVRYNVYGNNIRLFVFAYLMMGYADYFKSPKLRTLILCGLLWASASSFQSTALFLGIMIMVAIGIYELFYHRKELILPLIFSAMPLLVYAAFFLSYAVGCFAVSLQMGWPFSENFRSYSVITFPAQSSGS